MSDEMIETQTPELSVDRDASFAATSDRGAASFSSRGVDAREVALVAARAGDDKKADDVLVLDLSQLSDVCDYFVIMSGSNARLVDAVVDEIEERVAKQCGEHPFSIEGRDERTWILMDYGSVIVHVFTPEAREYYRLEKLWADAPRVDAAEA
ncbi:ribosome silencing factor [Collinsella intestinalis]|uniref:ribosome silencing factor n=1 Tax=Collinsella intestinalis TaxID=147207 RepID=UPI001957C481|nr:ribosome silencing factor [Collinsella intestinalis]MBM6682530.1 ribosome silencing factor [Collinsella intestinalis]